MATRLANVPSLRAFIRKDGDESKPGTHLPYDGLQGLVYRKIDERPVLLLTDGSPRHARPQQGSVDARKGSALNDAELNNLLDRGLFAVLPMVRGSLEVYIEGVKLGSEPVAVSFAWDKLSRDAKSKPMIVLAYPLDRFDPRRIDNDFEPSLTRGRYPVRVTYHDQKMTVENDSLRILLIGMKANIQEVHADGYRKREIYQTLVVGQPDAADECILALTGSREGEYREWF